MFELFFQVFRFGVVEKLDITPDQITVVKISSDKSQMPGLSPISVGLVVVCKYSYLV